MPIAPRNLRTLYGVGTPLYTPANSVSINCFYFYNLGSTPYAIVFLADGSAIQVNTITGATTTVLPPTTIISPGITQLGVAQYGSQYLIIVANQPNGYWVWDGTLLYQAGSLAPGVTMTNVGSGYGSPPVVTATGGFGSGAMFTPVLNAAGQVVSVTITNPGQGYHPLDTPTLVFTGGNQAGSGANITANLTFSGTGSGATFQINFVFVGSTGGIPVYSVSSVVVTNGGSGYSQVTKLQFSGGAIDFGPAAGTPTIVNGVITAVTVTNGGTYFNFNLGVTCSAVDAGYYFVSSVNIISGGSLYGPSAKITATLGGNPQSQATLTPILQSAVITGVNITSGGGYGSNTPPTLTVTDTATTAAGTVSLMPFGIQGNAIQTYAGHVWVFNGPVCNFSAPGSVSDFATSDGGGTFKSSDSFLKVGYTAAVQTNGFLFIIGDSSMNYISGVQVSTANNVTTTTFTNNNSDPETGTPYPASVTTFGDDIFLANQNGIYVSSGGLFVKKSEMLDGVFNSAPGIFNGMQLSAAKDLIFGKLVWMVLAPIKDPITGNIRNKLFMFNEKYWWASEQDVELTFIQTQEINSVFQAWGTDGKSIYPLFDNPSSAFTKVMQSRFWDAPAGYDHLKTAVNIFAIAQFFGQSASTYVVTIDNENGPGGYVEWRTANGGGSQWINANLVIVLWTESVSAAYAANRPFILWVNALGNKVFWLNAANQLVPWYNDGLLLYAVLPPTAVGQTGVLLGMTVSTDSDDMILVSAMLQPEIAGYRA